jgi:hypothetical protein
LKAARALAEGSLSPFADTDFAGLPAGSIGGAVIVWDTQNLSGFSVLLAAEV